MKLVLTVVGTLLLPLRSRRSSAVLALPCGSGETPVRVVVVLGYSDGGRGELHPVCAPRASSVAEVATSEDVVVLSGWARVPDTHSEAELMRAWRGQAREVVVDPDARTTVENLANALNDVLRVGARSRGRHVHLARGPREGGRSAGSSATRASCPLRLTTGLVGARTAARAHALAAAPVPALVGRAQELGALTRAHVRDRHFGADV